MRSFSIVVALALLYVSQVAGQHATFIKTDSTIDTGILLESGDLQENAFFITHVKGSMRVKYTPEQLTAYGLADGSIYVTKTIEVDGRSQRVFLKQLVEGSGSLYYFSVDRRFFIQGEDGKLTALTRENFREVLRDVSSDCADTNEALFLVRYSRRSLVAFVTAYNNCERKAFPFTKFGVSAGYGTVHLVKNHHDLLVGANFEKDNTFTVGGYVDLPLMSEEYFSWTTGLSFVKAGFSTTFQKSDRRFYISINSSSISMPVLFKYTMPARHGRPRPYFSGGPLLSYNLENELIFQEVFINGNVVEMGAYRKEKPSSDLQGGIGGAAGVRFDLGLRKRLSAEIRYNHTLSKQFAVDRRETFLALTFTF